MKYYSDDKVHLCGNSQGSKEERRPIWLANIRLQKYIKVLINSNIYFDITVLVVFQSLFVKYVSDSITFTFPSYELFQEVK